MNNVKSMLKLFCKRATRIAHDNGYDIDLVNDIWLSCFCDEKDSYVFWSINSHLDEKPYEIELTTRYPMKRFFDGIEFCANMFIDNDIPNFVYDVILDSLKANDVLIAVKTKDFSNIESQYIAGMKDIDRRITELKSKDPNWWQNNLKLLLDMKNEAKSLNKRYNSTGFFKFLFFPKGIDSIAAARIWCDLHS